MKRKIFFGCESFSRLCGGIVGGAQELLPVNFNSVGADTNLGTPVVGNNLGRRFGRFVRELKIFPR